MKAPAVGVRGIRQVDNHSFEIEWSDGVRENFLLSKLQGECPCASCVDEETGERRASASSAASDVRARKLYSVGRYALRIEYTSGCSTGIYSYQFLYGRGRK